ncbi:MAG: 30S ribosomal protein S6 [Chloroflexi bacterium ADurb.Bin360]|nr:MAG: 30S ribosomal protein S6 [Chloroflexi bacterium ADurb.Bin360]
MVTRSYELLFIVSPELTEESLEALLNRVQNYLLEAGAAVAEFRNWGMRRLAYSIKGFREGRYYLARFVMPTNTIKDFERRLLLLEGVLRELIILVEDAPEGETTEIAETALATEPGVEPTDVEAVEPEELGETL